MLTSGWSTASLKASVPPAFSALITRGISTQIKKEQGHYSFLE